jgi:hypothetical protein
VLCAPGYARLALMSATNMPICTSIAAVVPKLAGVVWKHAANRHKNHDPKKSFFITFIVLILESYILV